MFNCIYSETEKRGMQSEVLDVDVFDCRLRRAAMGWAVITDWFVMTGLGTEMVDYNSGRVITNPPPPDACTRARSKHLAFHHAPPISVSHLSLFPPYISWRDSRQATKTTYDTQINEKDHPSSCQHHVHPPNP